MMKHTQSKTLSPLRVMLTGAGGQLGRALTRSVPESIDVQAYAHQDLDITHRDVVEQTIAQCKPHLIINAAAYTQVDLAEQNQQKAYAVNRDGALHIAQAAAQRGIALLHISTDYVFDGLSKTAYTETDEPHPINVYGASKLAGEQAAQQAHEQALIIRTSAVFGDSLGHKNFVTNVLHKAIQQQTLHVVTDQISCPTAAQDLACALWQLVKQYQQTHALPWGVLHCAGELECSRYEWAQQIIAIAKEEGMISYPVNMEPCLTADFPSLACRPAYSALDSTRIKVLCDVRAGNWQLAFRKMCQETLAQRSFQA